LLTSVGLRSIVAAFFGAREGRADVDASGNGAGVGLVEAYHVAGLERRSTGPDVVERDLRRPLGVARRPIRLLVGRREAAVARVRRVVVPIAEDTHERVLTAAVSKRR